MDIYADHASLKPLLPEVKAQIRNFVDCNFCNPSAIYSNARITRNIIEKARAKVAEAIGADSDEIFFTSGSTEAINWVMSQEFDLVMSAPIEHKAILNQTQVLWKLPINKKGTILIEGLDKIIDNNELIAIGYVNNEIGTIQPIKEIADICHQNKAKVFVDATQAIGNIPINVHELEVDYLCGSGQKIGALSGCGFLYVRKGSPISPMEIGGSQERGMRAGTENLIGILALATAIKVATKDIENKSVQTAKQRDKIIKGLLAIPKSHLNGEMGNRVCNNINMSFEGIEGESLVLQLDTRGIQCSTGSACNSHSIEPSHVLKAIGLSDDLARASVRFTIGDEITDAEVDYLIKAVTECVEQLRKMSPMWKEINNGNN